MKNKAIAVLLFFTVAVIASSCFSSRSKYGCPMNPQSGSYRFRG